MNRIDRRAFLAIAAMGTVAAAGCTEGGADDRSETDTDDGSEIESQEQEAVAASANESLENEFVVGERIERDGWQAVVRDVQRGSSPPDAVAAEAADEDAIEETAYLVLEFALKNTTADIVPTDEREDVELRDADGDTYPQFTTATNEAMPAQLAPGEVDRDELIFEVPDDASALTFVFDGLDESDTAPVVVDLEQEAEPRSDLDQKLDVDTHRFGESVEVDGIEVTISNLQQGNNLGGFMQADDGRDVVVIEVELTNQSGRERSSEPAQMALKDGIGRRYRETDAGVGALDRFEVESLGTDEETQGKLAYELEDGVSELYWIFDFAPWGSNERAFWQLR
ncbi:DUF4352 domain-containing protein [Natronorubrum thiooxidans]|uniref:DUF4352 domain-containing protein n=1 Tax=Natronorubrum thiooxidans TaxID=308853 RepID=A0A1N7GM36_9EURY|nr:DUF4352 domain-containing protein [Natronorubrum thiooxidans]SIS13647.1 protein of unknown function [Natronorubrum thiooxidans]